MDLNVNIDNTLLKLTLESGLVLNLQIPKPIQLSIAYGQYWGGIGGDIERQADLKTKFDDLWKYAKKNRKLAKAAL